MHKLIVKLSAAAIVAATGVAALQAAASARDVPHTLMQVRQIGEPAPAAADSGLSFTTTMISYTPVDVTRGGLAAGDGYVIAGKVTRYGAPDGLSTAQCTFTDTKGPVLRVCTVDYALDNGLIVTSGYINGPGKDAPVTLVIDGGTGAYVGVRGHGILRPTAAGSDVTLRLTG
jgi:hypothetical protein